MDVKYSSVQCQRLKARLNPTPPPPPQFLKRFLLEFRGIAELLKGHIPKWLQLNGNFTHAGFNSCYHRSKYLGLTARTILT